MLSELKSRLYLPDRDSRIYSGIKEIPKYAKEIFVAKPVNAIKKGLGYVPPIVETVWGVLMFPGTLGALFLASHYNIGESGLLLIGAAVPAIGIALFAHGSERLEEENRRVIERLKELERPINQ